MVVGPAACRQQSRRPGEGCRAETPVQTGRANSRKARKPYILLNGPDVGSISQPVEVEAGESKDFPFRLNDEGAMRLRLDYRFGSRPDVKCDGPAKDTKHIRSGIFTVG